MLVNNFTPPGPYIPRMEQPGMLAKKKEIFSQLHGSLKVISDTVPLAARMLKDILNRSMPKLFDNKAVSFILSIDLFFGSSCALFANCIQFT
jgi:RNA polymerase I-specific transcription initiation factor RRN3